MSMVLKLLRYLTYKEGYDVMDTSVAKVKAIEQTAQGTNLLANSIETLFKNETCTDMLHLKSDLQKVCAQRMRCFENDGIDKIAKWGLTHFNMLGEFCDNNHKNPDDLNATQKKELERYNKHGDEFDKEFQSIFANSICGLPKAHVAHDNSMVYVLGINQQHVVKANGPFNMKDPIG